jgi:hypothetical protein
MHVCSLSFDCSYVPPSSKAPQAANIGRQQHHHPNTFGTGRKQGSKQVNKDQSTEDKRSSSNDSSERSERSYLSEPYHRVQKISCQKRELKHSNAKTEDKRSAEASAANSSP